MVMQELEYKDITSKVISAAFQIFEVMGYGYPEKAYQRALELELSKRGLAFKRECYGKIMYDGEFVGKYFLDFLVENKVAVELKVRREMYDSDVVQLLGYLKSHNIKVGLLIVFAKQKPVIKRLVN